MNIFMNGHKMIMKMHGLEWDCKWGWEGEKEWENEMERMDELKEEIFNN